MKEIHYLGPEGSYCEIATKKFLQLKEFEETEYKLVPCSSILSVIENVDSLNNVIGVVPVENSIEGPVRETLDNLARASSKVMISRETIVKVSHCLVTKAKKYDEIKTIISYTQGLAQCKNFINRNMNPDVELVTSKSTSEAIKLLIDQPESYAAIGPEIAAQLYNLPILSKGINDQPENYTKFVMLGDNFSNTTGNDLTSIAIVLRNKPGALVEILQPFSENDINLCRIESRPSKKNLGEYVFFIDFNGHIQDENVKATIGKIAPNVDSYRFLDLMCLKMIVQLGVNLKEYLFVIDSISDVDDILYEKFKSV
ncbi:MAG: prephenate dehydratase, partial [Vampirovibrionia bacterium]